MKKLSRRFCAGCNERRARFRYRGKVKRDKDHTLCFACFRSQTDSLREALRRGD